jgi:hypothetical protein
MINAENGVGCSFTSGELLIEAGDLPRTSQQRRFYAEIRTVYLSDASHVHCYVLTRSVLTFGF